MSDRSLLGMAGKIAVIFGGGQGNGEAASLLFAEAGADVAVVDLDPARAERVAVEARAQGVRSESFAADLLDPEAIAVALDQVAERLGPPDALVTIIGRAEMKPAIDFTPEEWDRQMSINVRYFFFAAQAFARLLIHHGRAGTITGIASVDGVQGAPVHAPYGAAKAAMMHLVRSLAVEWADHGIRVNCLAAGSIVTPRVPETEASRKIMHDSLVPLRRSADPREIAGPLLFLSSDLATYVTGQSLGVDGGWMAANLFNMARDPKGARFASILGNKDKA